MKTTCLRWTTLVCFLSAALDCAAQTNFASTSHRFSPAPAGLSLTFSNALLSPSPGQASQIPAPLRAMPGTGRLMGPMDNTPECAQIPAGLVSWWRAEDDASDALLLNNGTLQGGVGFVSGQVGQAFIFNGASGDVEVPDSASLQLTSELTIEFWVQRQNVQHEDYIINKGGDYTSGALDYGVTLNSSQWGSALVFTFAGGYRRSVSIADLDWHHIAVVARNGDADPTFYVDGVAQPVTDSGGPDTITLYPSTEPLHIGAQVDPASGWNYYSSALVDEMSLYNTALSAEQILAIYDAGVAGKCLQIPPQIVTQPQSQRVPAGRTATLNVSAVGTSPLSYQWSLNGTPLASGTDSALVLDNPQVTDSGSYSVVVTNPWGSALSSNAVLDVYNPVCADLPAGLVGWWAAEGDAYDALCQNNGTIQGGVSFVTGQVSQAFSFDGTSGDVEVPDSASLRLTGELTIEFWVQRQNAQNEDYIINKGGDYTAGALDYGVTLNSSQWGSALAFTFAGGYRRSVSIADLNWHHIAVVARNGDADPTFYVDGVAQPVTDSGGPETITLYPSTEPLHIGAQIDPASGWNFYSSALVDEVSLYNTALSAEQILAIYKAGVAGKCNIPAAWLAYYFGPDYQTNPLAGVTADADGDGTTNLQEYLNGADPNKIRFSPSVANQYVNFTPVPLQLSVSGVPASMAILLDSTNFAAANWTPYSPNPAIDLGTSEGWHDVWVGLRGWPADSPQHWAWTRLKLDLTPPLLTITNPASTNLTQPLLQVQGFCPESLASLSYDLSNAAGLLTNQDVLVLDQFYDTNTWEFTTNTFQAFDLQLTNGLNTITFHATDLAGNASTVSFTYLLTNDTAPPVVTLGWPQDGQKLCGESFTVDGWLDDPSALVQVVVVDSSGVTNTMGGLVERDGRFWVENLPLADGANLLALTATDAWGNTATTNITVYKSDIALSILPIDPSQLFQPTVSLQGTVSDPTCTIWVNGVPAVNNGDGTWQASGVPVNQGGTASFAVAAYPAGHDLEAGAASLDKSNVDLPDRLYVEEDGLFGLYTYDTSFAAYNPDGSPDSSESVHMLTQYTHSWADGTGGFGAGSSEYSESGSTGDSSAHASESFSWPASSWPNFVPGTENYQGDAENYLWVGLNCGDTANAPLIGGEHCEVSDPRDLSGSGVTWFGGYWEQAGQETYSRYAQTQMKLFTGGKAIPGRKSLFSISGSADELLDKRAYPPYAYPGGGGLVHPFPYQPVPNENITLGVLGPLGNDGFLYKALPDCAAVNVTPLVPDKQFYWFGVTEQKSHPYIRLTTATTNANLDTDTPEVCVGQHVKFELDWDTTPPNILDTLQRWTLPPKLVNEPYYYAAVCTSYRLNTDLLTNNPTWCWYVNKPGGRVSMWQNLHFSNGQYVTITADGNFTVYRPSFSDFQCWMHTFLYQSPTLYGDMRWNVTVNSKYPGSIGITQLINGSAPFYSTDGEWYLDGNTEIYDPPQAYDPDNPSTHVINLWDNPSAPTFGYLHMVAAFQDYLRLRPGPLTGDSIWITLGTNGWSMNGVDQSSVLPAASAVVDSDVFPVWVGVRSSSRSGN